MENGRNRKAKPSARAILEAIAPSVKKRVQERPDASPKEIFRSLAPKLRRLVENALGTSDESALSRFKNPRNNEAFARRHPGLDVSPDGEIGALVVRWTNIEGEKPELETGRIYGESLFDLAWKVFAVESAFRSWFGAKVRRPGSLDAAGFGTGVPKTEGCPEDTAAALKDEEKLLLAVNDADEEERFDQRYDDPEFEADVETAARILSGESDGEVPSMRRCLKAARIVHAPGARR